MATLRSIFTTYRRIERSTRNAIAAQFCVQASNTAFFLLLNFYMSHKGFEDYEIADVLSYRFLAVFLLAFPIGLYIKGRKLKPFFYLAAIGVPILSHLIILSVEYDWRFLLNVFAMIWGVAYTSIQISILPFILLNSKPEHHSEAFALSFLSFSVTICLVGLVYALAGFLFPGLLGEKLMLQIVATLSFLSLFFVSRIDIVEKFSKKIPFSDLLHAYDWRLILHALIPTILIAIGAGFTIPVINLFFLHIHGMDSDVFSILGSATFFLVAVVMFFIPIIRRNFGYRVAITLFQSLAVLALAMLALTEFYRYWTYAVWIAGFFFVIRQPLMNAAGPMTSELSMYYVGKKNQEIMSALNASIWSGSWFVSTAIFSWLRQMEFRYVTIFLITVVFYALGVIGYFFLIRAYEKRQEAFSV
ncbi:MAG: MFS transporter [Saprospiraceae bacterium]|nr:MAG: MFS transporter [Saprospiraceae bacterium]